MQSSNWLKENPEMAIGCAALLASLVFGGGLDNLKQTQAYGNQLKAERTSQQQQLVQDQLREDALKQRSQLAQERIDRGCFQVFTSDGSTQSVITEGSSIVDLSSGQLLPDGVTVCDMRFGITAVIQNGVASDLAVVNSNPNEKAEG